MTYRRKLQNRTKDTDFEGFSSANFPEVPFSQAIYQIRLSNRIQPIKVREQDTSRLVKQPHCQLANNGGNRSLLVLIRQGGFSGYHIQTGLMKAVRPANDLVSA